MLGGHVVKTGIAPLLVDLMRRGAVTHLAANGSAAIHDYEMARWGGTSEDVEAGLADGTFGMAEETGRDMNAAFRAGWRRGGGWARRSRSTSPPATTSPTPSSRCLVQTHRLGVPFTLHPAIGAEIIHQHPAADGAAIGATGHRDFRRLAAALPGLDEGGVVVNVGSAVIMPEVFLKALTIARNLGEGRPRGSPPATSTCSATTARASTWWSGRRGAPAAAGYQITGPHELMVPLLAWALAERLPPRSG
jgi:hypothetical protein